MTDAAAEEQDRPATLPVLPFTLEEDADMVATGELLVKYLCSVSLSYLLRGLLRLNICLCLPVGSGPVVMLALEVASVSN